MANKLYKGNCIYVMNEFMEESSVDIILTSPFYNTARKTMTEYAFDYLNRRYDIHLDDMTDSEYENFTVDLFNGYDKVLKNNGVILYNMSYSTNKPFQMYDVVHRIMKDTDFTVADTIVWKKKSALPNNMNHNRLTRITEFIFVFCRKNELKTFNANKKVISTREKTGQKNYENVFNFIEAKNNDGTNKLNKATFSTELCEKLLNIYAKENSVIFDSFNGSGTTGVASIKANHTYIGCELSEAQCEYSVERIYNETGVKVNYVK